jgi:FkbM family methyltransferase
VLGDLRTRLRPIEWAGRALRRAGTEILRRGGKRGIWIDVGAHHGETTLGYANHNPGLTIYAFEPNLRAASALIGRAPNFIVIPMAVAESNGYAEFHINAAEVASSLLRMDDDVRRSWPGGEVLSEDSVVGVPTVRLDTFMGLMGIAHVDYLKIDTQGTDLAVLRSAGSRLRDISKITLEVDVSPKRLYEGSASKEEIVAYLSDSAFRMASTESQSSGREENLNFVRGNELS